MALKVIVGNNAQKFAVMRQEVNMADGETLVVKLSTEQAKHLLVQLWEMLPREERPIAEMSLEVDRHRPD